MGSDSDLPIAEKAVGVLLELGIPYEVHVYSAHRTPAMAAEFARRAEERGFGVIIAIAGMAAHLAGSLAAGTTLPVIGIPCKSNTLDGIDALPVDGTDALRYPGGNGRDKRGVNAALLSAQMLALGEPELAEKLRERRRREAEAVLQKDSDISARLG